MVDLAINAMRTIVSIPTKVYIHLFKEVTKTERLTKLVALGFVVLTNISASAVTLGTVMVTTKKKMNIMYILGKTPIHLINSLTRFVKKLWEVTKIHIMKQKESQK